MSQDASMMTGVGTKRSRVEGEQSVARRMVAIVAIRDGEDYAGVYDQHRSARSDVASRGGRERLGADVPMTSGEVTARNAGRADPGEAEPAPSWQLVLDRLQRELFGRLVACFGDLGQPPSEFVRNVYDQGHDSQRRCPDAAELAEPS